MSYILKTNVPSNDVAAINIPVTGVDAAQYSLESEKAGQVKYVNITSPIGLPLSVLLKQRITPNIYGGSRIPAVSQLPSKQGVELHESYHQTWTFEPEDVTGSCCTADSFVAPASCTMTIRVPNHPLVTEAVVQKFVEDALGFYFNVNSKGLLGKFLRGALRLD
jgi:hypothetical protein